MVITRLKNPWACLRLCMLIRLRKFKATNEVRSVAKAVSFAETYGAGPRRMLDGK